jgi:hypothetical protein
MELPHQPSCAITLPKRPARAARCQHRGLQTENEPKAVLHILQRLPSHAPGELEEEVAVDGNDLRDIRHGVFPQTGRLRREKDVPRGVEQPEVGGEHYGHHRAKTTPVEGVILHDEDGTVDSGLRAVGFAEVRPPYLAALDYHDGSRWERPCARRRRGFSRLSSDAYTALRRAVVLRPRCFKRNSARAVAYRRLRDTPSFFPSISAASNKSSGIDNPIFIP